MMNLHLETGIGTYHIQTYDSQSVTVNNVRYTHSLIVLPEHLERWAVESFDQLQVAHFEPLLKLQPDLILLGTGPSQRFPDLALLAPLHQAGIGVEVMNNAAACRTYMALIGDGRKVAAALVFR